MAKFIVFHKADGGQVAVNADHIRLVLPSDSNVNVSNLWLSPADNYRMVEVLESFEQVVLRLKGEPK